MKKRGILFLGSCAVVTFCALAYAQYPAPKPDRGQPNPPGSEPGGGPYFHKIGSASSKDGLSWTRDDGFRLEHASVPSAIATDGKIILYYVDADRGSGMPESISCATSADGINFEKQKFTIERLPSEKAVDPSIWRDPAGKFRLYYFACDRQPDEAGAHNVRLALSDDGINFRDECLSFSHESLVDPDIFFFKGTWFMYVFGKGNTIVATSQDGKSFTYQQELGLRGWGTVAPLQLADGRLRLYAFDQTKPSGNAVGSFLSEDGIHWNKEDGIRLQAGAKEMITDPFVVRWKDGYKMYFKIEDRGRVQKDFTRR